MSDDFESNYQQTIVKYSNRIEKLERSLAERTEKQYEYLARLQQVEEELRRRENQVEQAQEEVYMH